MIDHAKYNPFHESSADLYVKEFTLDCELGCSSGQSHGDSFTHE
jgi:hypothetical protein